MNDIVLYNYSDVYVLLGFGGLFTLLVLLILLGWIGEQNKLIKELVSGAAIKDEYLIECNKDRGRLAKENDKRIAGNCKNAYDYPDYPEWNDDADTNKIDSISSQLREGKREYDPELQMRIAYEDGVDEEIKGDPLGGMPVVDEERFVHINWGRPNTDIFDRMRVVGPVERKIRQDPRFGMAIQRIGGVHINPGFISDRYIWGVVKNNCTHVYDIEDGTVTIKK